MEEMVVTPQADVAEEIIDIGTAEPQPADEPVAEPAHDGDAKPKIENQKDFNYALNRRLEEERKKYAKRYESRPKPVIIPFMPAEIIVMLLNSSRA